MRGVFKPLICSQINSLGDAVWLNTSQREVPIVISLFSERENFENLPITLYSLFNQELKPDKIVLYLDEDYEDLANLPYEITQFVKNGLEIRFVQNIKKYTKTIYALKDFKNSIVISVEDSVFYPTSWLNSLYLSYISHPKDVQVFEAFLVVKDNVQLRILNKFNELESSYSNFPIEAQGVLYPPECFTNEVFRQDVYLKYFKEYPELWFWTMSLVNNRQIRIVKKNYSRIVFVNYLKKLFSRRSILESSINGELKKIVKLYGNYILRKL